jgi:hypothetical protein
MSMPRSIHEIAILVLTSPLRPLDPPSAVITSIILVASIESEPKSKPHSSAPPRRRHQTHLGRSRAASLACDHSLPSFHPWIHQSQNHISPSNIMAEVAAGLWAAEEVVSTGVQAGVAAYMVSQPTMPLMGTFRQIATAPDDNTR